MVKTLKTTAYIAFTWLIITVLTTIPAAGQVNDCEKLAKEYQQIYGGDLVLIQPLNDNGAYDLGMYTSHWVNKAWNPNYGVYYYDAQDKAYYFDVRTLEHYFESIWNKDVVVFNYNRGEIPFAIIWHY